MILQVPMYIGEIAPKHMRGGLGTMNQVSVPFKFLLVYLDVLYLCWKCCAWENNQTANSLTTQVAQPNEIIHASFNEWIILLWSVDGSLQSQLELHCRTFLAYGSIGESLPFWVMFELISMTNGLSASCWLTEAVITIRMYPLMC